MKDWQTLRTSLEVTKPEENGGTRIYFLFKIYFLILNKIEILAPPITFGFVAPKLALSRIQGQLENNYEY